MAGLNKMQMQVFGRKARPYLPSLLNFNKTNEDYLQVVSYGGYIQFDNEFYIEIDFEFANVTNSYADVVGIYGGVGSCAILVNTTTTLLNLTTSSANFTSPHTISFNTRYKLKLRRASDNKIYLSYDGGSEILAGTRTGVVRFRTIGWSTTRYLTGKLYGFNINGESFNLTEGAGSTIYGSLGTAISIITSNAGGLTYINSTMWEAL